MTFDIIPSQSETEDINRVINDQESCIKTYQQVLSLHFDCETDCWPGRVRQWRFLSRATSFRKCRNCEILQQQPIGGEDWPSVLSLTTGHHVPTPCLPYVSVSVPSHPGSPLTPPLSPLKCKFSQAADKLLVRLSTGVGQSQSNGTVRLVEWNKLFN